MRINGTVECWGRNYAGESVPPGGEFASVDAGEGGHNCGVRTDGSVTCWGLNDKGQATPPPGEFASVSAGHRHTCGLRVGGSVECWGSNDNGHGTELGQATPPAGEFASVSAGAFHSCGLSMGGSVECWGQTLTQENAVVFKGNRFSSLSARMSQVCVDRAGLWTGSGDDECWVEVP